MVSETDWSVAIISQWREMPVGGVGVLLVALYLSIQIGRKQEGNKSNVLLIANLALVVAGVVLGFSQTSSDGTWSALPYNYNQNDYSSGDTRNCPIVDIPSVIGLTFAEAQEIFNPRGIPFSVSHMDDVNTLSSVPLDVSVARQTFLGPTELCFDRGDRVSIDVDMMSYQSTTVPAVGETTTTTEADPSTTTTIQPKTTTTTVG